VDVAHKVKVLKKEEFEQIKDRVLDISCAEENCKKDGSSMLLSKAVALAAVEYIEGDIRELKYKKRNFIQAKELYWSMLTLPEKILRILLRYLLPMLIFYGIYKIVF